ncbi:VAMP-associated protein [Coemansia reversa NRRL 1564]|uniref:VAMP-associated protein n=1 Tax=Coemansia reversa (strain ATCC 12441 / NRRL 1564) TaxID=763665 RepID=A0A2G5B7P4_COERN|nr:VAMP-associated protein [Coemansia reversa NRRL 1564]|eukprot:PIA15063.1 VAMP-associated protein [Coemansia reversa NRRL 1564]
MALVYEPGDALPFHGPFQRLTNTTLLLTNKNNGPVAFKVKTTAPKKYCVRPNAGRIESGDSIKIQITLQPIKEEISGDIKCRDKFLVQSIQISPEMDSMPTTELWAMVEREAKSAISEKRLRVRYVLPKPTEEPTVTDVSHSIDEKSSAATGALGNAAPAQQQQQQQQQQRVSPTSRTLPGPSPLANSVDSYNESSVDGSPESTVKDVPRRLSVQAADGSRPQTASNRLFPDSSTAPSPNDTTSFVDDYHPSSSALPSDSQTLKDELDNANAVVQDLRRQLSEYKAQLEKIGASKAGRPVSVQPLSDTIDGLSMQSVAIVALVAFLVGYFFF